jgi:hypothetical protein
LDTVSSSVTSEPSFGLSNDDEDGICSRVSDSSSNPSPVASEVMLDEFCIDNDYKTWMSRVSEKALNILHGMYQSRP